MIRVVVDNRLRFDSTSLPDGCLDMLLGEYRYANPAYYKTKAMGYWPGNVPKTICTASVDSSGLVELPRGGAAKMRATFRLFDVPYCFEDRSCDGTAASFPPFKLVLYPYQIPPIEAAIARRNCLIQAPTGSGKTSIGIAIVARLQRTSLVIVWSAALAKQWAERAGSELGLSRDRIGIIGGGKERIRDFTIGMQQSLYRGVGKRLARHFGVIICDECFEGSSPVLMADGTLRCISAIRVGDEVAIGGRVLATMKRWYDGEWYALGSGALATSEHPVACDRGWIPVSDIRDSDVLLHVSAKELRLDGANVRLAGVRASLAWNLETEFGVYVAGGVLVHNCQRFAAPTFQEAIEPFHARYRIGISADHTRKDGKEFLIHDVFGPNPIGVEKDGLVDGGFIYDVTIRVVPTEFAADWYRDTQDFGQLIDELSADEDRNRVVISAIKQALRADPYEHVGLVFAHRIEHCRMLDSMCIGQGLTSGLLLGGSDCAVEFARIVELLRASKANVGIGTIQAIGQGIDIPRVDRGILATPVWNNRQLFGQIAGRICRRSGGKHEAELWCLWDHRIFGLEAIRKAAKWNKLVLVQAGTEWVDVRSEAGRTTLEEITKGTHQ